MSTEQTTSDTGEDHPLPDELVAMLQAGEEDIHSHCTRLLRKVGELCRQRDEARAFSKRLLDSSLEATGKLQTMLDEARAREAELRQKYRMHHDESERLTKIERAALALIAAKGRHNTQVAFDALRSEVEG